MKSEFPGLSIRELFIGDVYTIPRYQRNYSWTQEQIQHLIDDILDSFQKRGENTRPYYLGTLVVYPRLKPSHDTIYEVIDGQQRLITLTLMASYLTYSERNAQNGNDFGYEEVKLKFSSRKRSEETLYAAHNGEFHDKANKDQPQKSYTEEIVVAYQIIQQLLPQSCREKNVDENDFKIYFFNHVHICRVSVPDDTDLNHYFEIMNNRGEQLEKHEILKSRLLSKLPEGNDQKIFNQIWEACSTMDGYIQKRFKKELRSLIFGESWNSFVPWNSDDLFQLLEGYSQDWENEGKTTEKFSLKNLVFNPARIEDGQGKGNQEEEEPERFSSIINFQNFLPHVLSIWREDGKIPLDDKQLLSCFEKLIDSDAEEIKNFGFHLLKCRFLFDQYIIKRDATEDERSWSLKMYHLTSEGNLSYRNSFNDDKLQKELSLLQSMFHVSAPSRPYKYWLQGTLRFLLNQSTREVRELVDIEAQELRDYLEGQATAFVFNRYLATSPKEYAEIIFDNPGKPLPADLSIEKTRYGGIQNILIFNYIDYLLWKKEKDSDPMIMDFSFTFRSSVEHSYPQNQINRIPFKDPEVIHSIGNLCLISHSKNSQLRDKLPEAKARTYRKQNYIDSILQYQMLKKAEEWSKNPEESIKMQEGSIIKLLQDQQPKNRWVGSGSRKGVKTTSVMR